MTLDLAIIYQICNTKSTNHQRKNKLDDIKNKNFCSSKDPMNRVKRQPTERVKISVSHVSNKQLILRIYKELQQLNNKK